MRAFISLVLATLLSIGVGIGICAASQPSPTTRALDLGSVGIESVANSPYVQIATSLQAPSVAAVRSLDAYRFKIELSSDNKNVNLANSKLRTIGIQVDISQGAAPLLSVRVIDLHAVFVRVDLSKILRLPGIPPRARRQGPLIAPLINERWFSIPESLISPIINGIQRSMKNSDTSPLSPSQENVLYERFQQATNQSLQAKVIGTNNGYVANYSILLRPYLKAVLPAFLPLLRQGGTALPTRSIQKALNALGGTVSARLSFDNKAALSNVRVTNKSKAGTATINASISHDTDVIGSPVGALSLPPPLVNAIGHSGQLPL